MPRPKAMENKSNYKFNKHQIVWAKISGYPWWPASITCTPSKTTSYYKVDFIGDRSYAFLSESKLAKYADIGEQCQSNKKNNKHFSNAVMIATRRYEQSLVKQSSALKSKCSIQCKTSQQKQQINKQIDLPQIQENIQQLSSQNQKKKKIQQNPFFQSESLEKAPQVQEQHLEQQKKPIDFQASNEKPFHQMKADVQHIESEDPQTIFQKILQKYKLKYIPDLKEKKQADKEQDYHPKKRIHWKKKAIGKQRKANLQQSIYQLNEEQLLVRKIYRFLITRLTSKQQCRAISLSIKQQIVRQKVQKVQCLKKLTEWIAVADEEHIANYYSQWINYQQQNQGQKQKHSTLTMEAQSEDIQVK